MLTVRGPSATLFRQLLLINKGGQIFDMALQRINPVLRRFAFAEPHMVRHDNPIMCRQGRYHMTIEIAPSRLAMQTQNHLALALIDRTDNFD